MSLQCRVAAASTHSTCRVTAASQARQSNCAASMPRHGRVKIYSCRVTAASQARQSNCAASLPRHTYASSVPRQTCASALQLLF
ncbi:hypothetical protein P692DRAFT_20215074 [Suillus brevipes Sb2]|nr:hypothetical protein P692DRAFT_20215074 [Suillus brevipes Sb2]